MSHSGSHAPTALTVTHPRRRRRGQRQPAVRAVAAFLAQLIGDRLARRRLDTARGAADSVHAAYHRGAPDLPAGARLDLSV